MPDIFLKDFSAVHIVNDPRLAARTVIGADAIGF